MFQVRLSCMKDYIFVDDILPVHWHGLLMKEKPFNDGVVHVTQCGIPPGQEYEYVIPTTGENPGTYWYHAHSGASRVASRGMAGMLIILHRSKYQP